MKTTIDIKSESDYGQVKKLMAINGIDNSTREKVINFALKLSADLISSLDEESLTAVTGYKKSL